MSFLTLPKLMHFLLIDIIVAAIVRAMCGMVVKELNEGNTAVTADVIRIMGITSNSSGTSITLSEAQRLSADSKSNTDILTIDSEQLCASILHTVYMGTCNSSGATQSRSLRLAQSIGAYHNTINIDTIVAAVLGVFTALSSACAFHPPGTIRSQVLLSITP